MGQDLSEQKHAVTRDRDDPGCDPLDGVAIENSNDCRQESQEKDQLDKSKSNDGLINDKTPPLLMNLRPECKKARMDSEPPLNHRPVPEQRYQNTQSGADPVIDRQRGEFVGNGRIHDNHTKQNRNDQGRDLLVPLPLGKNLEGKVVEQCRDEGDRPSRRIRSGISLGRLVHVGRKRSDHDQA